MSNRVVVVGSSNTDLIGYCDKNPLPGETIFGTKFHTGFGGKGANQCIMASKFKDVKVSMVTFLGKDVFGTSTLQNYKDNEVDTTFVRLCDDSTGCALITVNNSTGENEIIVIPGANYKLTPAFIEENYKEMFHEGDIVVCQNEIPLETTYAALKLAKECKCLTIWNPAPAPSTYDKSIISCVDEPFMQCE